MLLEITRVQSHEDVHGVIDVLNESRISALLGEQLKYSRADSIGFSMLLSEVSQNIIEHADAPGWVGIQIYNWAKRLGRKVAVIAVMDLGVGFKGLARQGARGALRRPLGRRHGAGGGLHPRDHALPRPRPRAGPQADPQEGGPLGRQDRHPQRHRPDRRRPRVGRRRPDDQGPAFFPGAQILIVLPAKE